MTASQRSTEDIPASLRALLGDAAVLPAAADAEPFLVDHRQLYRGRAAAIVQPDTTDAVSRLLAWCNAHRVSVVPQGGNTGYCGGATPDASGQSVLLLLRRMKRIRAVDVANFSLVAEAGCTLAAVQSAAATAQRYFPLSLGSEGSCQIGGNLATNAGGTAVIRYGMARDLTLGIEAVLADGSVLSHLTPLRKDNTGYDLRHLLIGSEGTLGIITAACLKLFPVQDKAATAWVSVADPAAAVTLLGLLREGSADSLSGCELLPAVALDLVLQHVPGTQNPGTAPSPWYLLVELTSSGAWHPEEALAACLARAMEQGLAQDAVIAHNKAQRANLWHIRESVPEAQRRAGASLKHDVAVPVSRLPELVTRGAALAAQLVPDGFLLAYGHVGDGNLHFNINLRAAADAARFRAGEAALKRAIHDLVADLQGSFSAEHGIGALKVDELARYSQPAERSAMQAIKKALDPLGILNPGKVLL